MHHGTNAAADAEIAVLGSEGAAADKSSGDR